MLDSIQSELMKERNKQITALNKKLERVPYIIQEKDVGRSFGLGSGLGTVLKCDVGKKLYMRGGVIEIENDEQLQKRLSKKI